MITWNSTQTKPPDHHTDTTSRVHPGFFVPAPLAGQGTVRYLLDGTEAGEITAYQQQFAADILTKRQQAKA